MRTIHLITLLLTSLLFNCAATSDVVYDYNLDINFNDFDTYVLCIEDYALEHIDHPKFDNEQTRAIIGDAIALEMENKGHRTNVFEPQLQAGFKLLLRQETAQFNNCEHSEELGFWENCKIHEETYEQESLVVYVADFDTNEVLWHASLPCDFNKSKKQLERYIDTLVKDLFSTYPKTQIGKNPDEAKDF